MSDSTEDIQNDLTNLGLSWLLKDLASSVPSGGRGFGNYALVVISIGGLVFGIMVQRGVYLMLQRQKRREINRLIYPNLVFASFLLPYLTIDIILQQFVYPIKDVTGEWYCYASRYFETYCFYIYLSNSFFVNFYRYMCVVHSDLLRNWSINIRDATNVTIWCMYAVPAIFLLPIFLSSDRIPPLNVCLGHAELDFLGKSGFRYDSLLSKLVSYTLLAISMPIFLNILDLYFLKQVYNQCEKQADGVKALLSEEAYRARKRDNGIILETSKNQLIFEMVHSISFVAIVFLTTFFDPFSSWNESVGKIYGAINFLAVTIIQPGFYFLGDIRFRRKYHNQGLFVALKEVLLSTD